MKDNIPTDRVPVVTLLLIAAGVVAQLLADDSALLALLASALFLWIFGTSVEDATSRPRFLVLWLLGAGVAVGLGGALDDGAGVATVGAAGGTAAVLGGYARLYPRARIVSLLPVPTAFTLFELPAWALLVAWLAIQAAFALTSVNGPSADGGAAAYVAPLAAFALGLLAIGLLARRRKRLPPPRSAIPARP
ncbi:MAG TPA: rhomboid family intramembrane serine protease [Conexibacter sp.]|nr:rhomboid family intramembrane serine protease [Conexibacter sp.]